MCNSAEKEALKTIQSMPRHDGEAVFQEPWEARAFAMAVELNEKGVFSWSEWGEQFSENLKINTEQDEPVAYYKVWMKTLEQIIDRLGIADFSEQALRQKEWEIAAARTPHGVPIVL